MTNNEIGSVSRRTFVQTTAAATAAMMFPGGASVAGSDVIRVGVIGCGGRGTGAAHGLHAIVGRRRDRRARRSRCPIAWRSAAPRSPRKRPATPHSPRKYKVTDERALHRLRRLPEGARDRHRLRHPRHAAGLPADAPGGGRRGRQAHLHREAGRGRLRRHPLGARDLRARRSRRASASASARSAAIRPNTSRRSSASTTARSATS